MSNTNKLKKVQNKLYHNKQKMLTYISEKCRLLTVIHSFVYEQYQKTQIVVE